MPVASELQAAGWVNLTLRMTGHISTGASCQSLQFGV